MTSQKWPKMALTRKIKMGKILNLVFLPIQPILDLSSKFEKLKINKNNFFLILNIFFLFLKNKNNFFLAGGFAPLHPPTGDPTCFWIEDSRRNRLVLTDIQRIACLIVFLHNSKNKNRKFDFSFDSADCGSFMWIWPLLKKKLDFDLEQTKMAKKNLNGMFPN